MTLYVAQSSPPCDQNSGTLQTSLSPTWGGKCQCPRSWTLLWRLGISLAHCRPCGSHTWVTSASFLVAWLSCDDEAFLWHTADHMGSPTWVANANLLVAILSCGDGAFLWHICRPCGSHTWVASASLLIAVLPHVGTVLRHAACDASRLGQNTCNTVS